MTIATTSHAAAFYYTPNGIEGDSTPLEHLAIGQAEGIVSDGRTNLESGRLVLNYAKLNGEFYAQVGYSTGANIDRAGQAFWNHWKVNGNVFEVVWISNLTKVPASLFSSQRQRLGGEVADGIVDYILRSSNN